MNDLILLAAYFNDSEWLKSCVTHVNSDPGKYNHDAMASEDSAKNYSPWHWAAHHNNPELLHVLLNNTNLTDLPKARNGLTALEVAAMQKSYECLCMFIDWINEQLKNNSNIVLQNQLKKIYANCLLLLIKNYASLKREEEKIFEKAVRKLIYFDADITHQDVNRESLMVVALNHRCAAIAYALAREDYLLRKRTIKEIEDAQYPQALLQIMKNKNKFTSSELISLSRVFVYVNQTFTVISPDDGNSVLHCAISLDNVDLVSWWLDNGADPQQRNYLGHTPAEHLVANQYKLNNAHKIAALFNISLIDTEAFKREVAEKMQSLMNERLRRLEFDAILSIYISWDHPSADSSANVFCSRIINDTTAALTPKFGPLNEANLLMIREQSYLLAKPKLEDYLDLRMPTHSILDALFSQLIKELKQNSLQAAKLHNAYKALCNYILSIDRGIRPAATGSGKQKSVTEYAVHQLCERYCLDESLSFERKLQLLKVKYRDLVGLGYVLPKIEKEVLAGIELSQEINNVEVYYAIHRQVQQTLSLFAKGNLPTKADTEQLIRTRIEETYHRAGFFKKTGSECGASNTVSKSQSITLPRNVSVY